MKIAIPMVNGQLSMHFGHCEEFALVEVDENEKKILKIEKLTPPPHEPGVLPKWLNEQGANVIIAGGMGSRAQDLFAEQSIQVVVGATGGTVEELTNSFLNNSLKTGDNLCDH